MGKEIKKCIIISGAPEKNTKYYLEYIENSFIIAADSGYKKCLDLKIKPDLIIGDFDSLGEVPKADCEIITLPIKKDDTDTAFAAKEAIKRNFKNIIILGALGDRFDHCYSNILTLNYLVDSGANAAIISEKSEIHILNGNTVIKKSKYKFFSVFSLFDKCCHLTMKGCGFTLNDYTLEPKSPLGQSNYFIDDEVSVSFDNGKILLIMSND